MRKSASFLWCALPLVIFLLIAFFLWQGLKRDPHEIPSALIGKPVPAFNYPALMNPQQFISNKEFLGHISLLNVWATWCISCRAEHPILMDIARTQTVKIYGLNYKDQRESAIHWLKQYGDPYQNVIFDEKGDLGINLGVYGTPETFIIDSQGIIRYKYIGPISPDAWQDDVLPEIKKIAQD